MMSMVNAVNQYFTLHWSYIFDTQTYARIILDCFTDGLLSMAMALINIWSNLEPAPLILKWILYIILDCLNDAFCVGHANPGSTLSKQSMAQSVSAELCYLFVTFELDKQNMWWALMLTHFNTMVQKSIEDFL